MGKFFGVTLICLILSSSILADGGFFWEIDKINVTKTGESPHQRAIVIHNDSKETLIIQVKYQGAAEKFAWIIPLPALPSENEIKTISDSVFEKLEDMTKPELHIIYNSLTYSKDASESGAGEESIQEQPLLGVQVWNRLQVGPYNISLISGQSTEALISWLSNNGYDFPDKATSIIDFYQQKKWYFAAIRIEVDRSLSKNTADVVSSLPPIQMTFETSRPVFPLRISELTAAPKNEIEIFIIAKCQMVTENYHTQKIDKIKLQEEVQEEYNQKYLNHYRLLACSCNQPTDPQSDKFEYDYQNFFSKQIAAMSTTTFLMEYSMDNYFNMYNPEVYGHLHPVISQYFPNESMFWLTRLRTIMSPAQMTDDVYFKQNQNHVIYPRIMIIGKVSGPWNLTFLVIPPLFLIFLLLYRRTDSSNKQKFLLFLMILIIAFS